MEEQGYRNERGEMEFQVKWCEVCKAKMVICPKCGNNCCNGGYGKMDKDGKALPWKADDEEDACDVCPLAYQYQKLHGEMEIICTCDKECICEWEDNGTSLFDERTGHDDKCPIHNTLPPDKNCPIHKEDVNESNKS